jgi:hypothetical protein
MSANSYGTIAVYDRTVNDAMVADFDFRLGIVSAQTASVRITQHSRVNVHIVAQDNPSDIQDVDVYGSQPLAKRNTIEPKLDLANRTGERPIKPSLGQRPDEDFHASALETVHMP